MPIAQIITLAIAGIEQLTKALTAANNGDEVAARAALVAARTHFDVSLENWDSTKAP